MNEPITVSIKNNATGRVLTWLGKGKLWAGAGATVTVDYEPWSCADRKQRSMILAELRGGKIELTLHILTAAGQIDLRYDPNLAFSGYARPAVATAAPVQAQPADSQSKRDLKFDNSDHIVVAGSNRINELGLGLKAEIVKPPVSERRIDNAEGFMQQDMDATVDHAVQTGQQKQAAEEPASAQETQAAPEAAPEASNEPVDLRGMFNTLCADKQWNEALQLLIGAFGADKITFTTRSIMAMKDYDAVVKKYGLE